jgi:hypothetical protein
VRLRFEAPQEIFDEACRYFAAADGMCIPDARYTGDTAGCRYLIRTSGKRCVGGHMIEIETHADENVLVTFSGSFDWLNEQHRITDNAEATRLIGELQRVHDSNGSWAGSLWGHGRFSQRGWDRLLAIAADRGLDTSVLEEYASNKDDKETTE